MLPALLLAGCDGAPSSMDPPTAHVFEDLLGAWMTSSPSPDPTPVVEDPLGAYAWERALEWFDPIMRDGRGIIVEMEMSDCWCGPFIAVEVTRTDEGGWLVGEAAEVGMTM